MPSWRQASRVQGLQKTECGKAIARPQAGLLPMKKRPRHAAFLVGVIRLQNLWRMPTRKPVWLVPLDTLPNAATTRAPNSRSRPEAIVA
jgi:hypothetical protein